MAETLRIKHKTHWKARMVGTRHNRKSIFKIRKPHFRSVQWDPLLMSIIHVGAKNLKLNRPISTVNFMMTRGPTWPCNWMHPCGPRVVNPPLLLDFLERNESRNDAFVLDPSKRDIRESRLSEQSREIKRNFREESCLPKDLKTISMKSHRKQ